MIDECCCSRGRVTADGITLPGGFSVFNNKLYIVGGFRINTAMTNQIWEFTPTSQRVGAEGRRVTRGARFHTSRGLLLILFTPPAAATGMGRRLWIQTIHFRYDPVGDLITSRSQHTEGDRLRPGRFRFACGAALCASNMGDGRRQNCRRTPPTKWTFDCPDIPRNGRWVCHSLPAAAQFPERRRRWGSFSFGTGRVWLAGGYASDGVTPLRSMETFCHSVPTPSEPPPMTPTATFTATPTATLPPPTPTTTPTASATPTVTPPGVTPTPSDPGWHTDGNTDGNGNSYGYGDAS